ALIMRDLLRSGDIFRLRKGTTIARKFRKFPTDFGNIPVFGRLSTETFSIGTEWQGGSYSSTIRPGSLFRKPWSERLHNLARATRTITGSPGRLSDKQRGDNMKFVSAAAFHLLAALSASIPQTHKEPL